MVGEWAGYYRIRVGKLRIIFWFDEKDDVVYVDHIMVGDKLWSL